MIEQGVDTFIEIGPGTVLSRLIRRIDRDVLVCDVSDAASLDETLRELA